MKSILIKLALLSLFTSLYADNMHVLAKKMNLYAGTKASVQWKRIFSSQRRLEQYGLTNLDHEKLEELKNYLIKHAADSNQPVVPGL